MSTDFETLLVENQDHVCKITLNRPDKLNALSQQLLQELVVALEQAKEDANCRCVLLTGAGRGFSSGADLTDPSMRFVNGKMPDLGESLEKTYHPVLRLIRGMDKPVIAAINGTAAGAGLNIALAADVVVSARSAKLIQAFIRIGLVPDAGGTWSIPRLIGRARAAKWMMSGEVLQAEKAEQWGLLSEVFDDEELPAKAEELAQRMSRQPTVALAGIKRLMDSSLDNDMNSQMAAEAAEQSKLSNMHDTMEGIMSFVQKREPNFKGS